MTTGRSVAIIGSGAAGLASAIAHEARGWRVSLFESRSRLGGRAWSREQDDLDNGPHVLLGCYESFRSVLRTIGSEAGFYRADALELSWLKARSPILRLRPSSRLPAPLHLLHAMLSLKGVPTEARFELLSFGLSPFLRLPAENETLAAWMRRTGQGQLARQLMIVPLCLAVMNEEPNNASARLFLATLREAFLGNKAHSAIWIPKRSWAALLSDPAERWARRAGIELRKSSRVESIEPLHEPNTHRIHLRGGETLQSFDRIVVASPWKEAARLLPFLSASEDWASIESSAILTVHLELDEALPFDDPVVALLDGEPFHFLCRRSDNDGHARTTHELSMLAGAANSLEGTNARSLVRMALDQLADFLGRPRYPDSLIDRARVMRESSATLRPTPEVDRLRPPPGPTAIPGIWLAGDWCATGLPSTLEGAARSGLGPVQREAT